MISRARRPIQLSLLALALLGPPSAAQQVRGVGEERAPLVDAIGPGSVLAIDGEPVPAEAFAAWLIEELSAPHLKDFAVGWEIGRIAEERGLAADETQIATELDEEIATRIQGAFRGERAGWVAELARTGRSVDGHRVQRTAELETLLDAFNLAREDRVVPEAKIVRDWELQHGPRGRAFDLELLKVGVVMQMPEESNVPENVARAREQARAEGLAKIGRLRERILAGEDFAALARSESDDLATRGNGGRVPRFVQFGWPSAFVDALFELQKGELSQPVFARGGWWLIRVRDWVDVPLESVRAELTRRLIEAGPEQDEVGQVWNDVAATIEVKVEPGLYSASSQDDGEGPDAIGLSVNGRPVPRKVVARWMLHTRGEAHWAHFSEEWLLRRRAQSLGLSVDEAELDARVEEHFARVLDESFKGDRGVWRAYTEAAGTDPEAWMRQLRRRREVALLAEKLILAERQVTPEDVKAVYLQRYGATGRRVQARALLLEVPTPPMPNSISKEESDKILQAALEARRKDAEELRARALAGEDFVTLVRQHSDDRISKERDGLLEGGFRPDGWSSEVSEEVMALPRGAISKVVQEGRFLAVFEVLDFEEVSLESVAAEIERELRERRPAAAEIAAYRNVLLKAATIDLLPDLRR
jgi:parvulin-like peptidyl-prolyl isomerase